MNTGSNTLLLGVTGVGKTYSIRTFLDAGITPFVITTEPGIESTLGDTNPNDLHWHYIAPSAEGWDSLIDVGQKINTLSYDALAKMSGMNKQMYSGYMDFLNTCQNFTCDRTGESFGDVTEWGPDRALVVDSLSGLNILAMDLVVGNKPTKAMQDWMVAQNNLEKLITKLTTGTRCYFVLTAHLEREQDEVTGAIQLTASTLGKKLAPKITRFFDDVVQVKREGTRFTWSTAAGNVDVKARNLAINDNLPPSFKPIVDTRAAMNG